MPSRKITREAIARQLYTAGSLDPDLIIRTSVEVRLSGFLLWQSAYSEFYFCEVPAFARSTFCGPSGPINLGNEGSENKRESDSGIKGGPTSQELNRRSRCDNLSVFPGVVVLSRTTQSISAGVCQPAISRCPDPASFFEKARLRTLD